ncbi:MFS transporter [Actinorhabdospora filicis]|nr:MFS transporter [Actinorhabdospora filicis]
MRLPIGGLAALTTAAFITVVTEALPAGVLPEMAGDLGVSESAAGQAVTVYAVATALSAIPLTALTASWRRRTLLLTGVGGFAVANTVTTVSPWYALTMTGRLFAGIAAGLVWALLAGYARRMAPGREGRAIAIVMAGIPLALSLGIPAGTFLGGLVGWRVTFGLMTAVAVVLLGWIALAVPDFPGEARGQKMSWRVPPAVYAVLGVMVAFVLAHNVLYTYIAPYLSEIGMGGSTDLVLLVFGISSIASIWLTGLFIDRRLRALTIGATLLVIAAAVLLLVGPVYAATVLWGLGWGGIPTLLQTAAGRAGGDRADAAQTILVALWNAAMAGGGIAGGVLLDGMGARAFPYAVLGLLVLVLAVLIPARRAFPRVTA